MVKRLIRKYIKGNEVFTRFVKVFSVDFLVRGGNFLLIPIFLRIMSPEEYGLYGYLYSFAITMSGIFGFGFYVSLTKLHADTLESKTERGSMLYTLSTALFVLLISSLLIVYAFGIDKEFFTFLNKTTADINAREYTIYRTYIFVAIIAMTISNFLTFYLVSSEKIRGLQTFNLSRFILSNLIAILIIYFSKGDAVFQRLSITYSIELALVIVFLIGLRKNLYRKFSRHYLTKAFKIGLPIMVSAIMYAVINFGDKFFVVKYSGEKGMSIYYLAFLLATIVLIIYQSFNFIWNPLFMKEKDLVVLRRKTNRYIILLGTSFTLIGAAIWLGSLIALNTGIIPKDYGAILEILPLLILSQIFAALSLLMINFMTYFEKTYIQVFVGAGLSIIGYYMFDTMGKHFGLIGISITMIILNLTQFIFFYFRSQYYINNRLRG